MIGRTMGFDITVRHPGAVLTSRIPPEPSVDVSLDNGDVDALTEEMSGS